MQEQIITHKTALLAKEKGFTYFKGNPDVQLYEGRPTQSLLQKFLREEHNIIVIPDYNINEVKYFYWIIKDEKVVMFRKEVFDSWEDALEQGLYESLKLIK